MTLFLRLLEEGKIQDAENAKTRLEHLQRERRKKRDAEGTEYNPMWFKYGLSFPGSILFIFVEFVFKPYQFIRKKCLTFWHLMLSEL